MEHSFDIDIAKEYGIECAIILKHLYFWIEKNKACDRHFHAVNNHYVFNQSWVILHSQDTIYNKVCIYTSQPEEALAASLALCTAHLLFYSPTT